MPQLHLSSFVEKHPSRTVFVFPGFFRSFSQHAVDQQIMLQPTRFHRIIPQHFEAQCTLRFLGDINEDSCKFVVYLLFTVLSLFTSTSRHPKSRQNKKERTSGQAVKWLGKIIIMNDKYRREEVIKWQTNIHMHIHNITSTTHPPTHFLKIKIRDWKKIENTVNSSARSLPLWNQ